MGVVLAGAKSGFRRGSGLMGCSGSAEELASVCVKAEIGQLGAAKEGRGVPW